MIATDRFLPTVYNNIDVYLLILLGLINMHALLKNFIYYQYIDFAIFSEKLTIISTYIEVYKHKINVILSCNQVVNGIGSRKVSYKSYTS